MGWFKPNLEEIQSYRKRPPVLATIYTLEGKAIDYPVTPEMAVHQVLDLVRRKERIDDDIEHPTWGIYVMPEEEEEVETPRERLLRFYKKYNPAKIAHMDMFLDHWKDNPEELFEKLVAKYGPEPSKDAKKQEKGMLSKPIIAAMEAVKFLGQKRAAPPAPEVPWALPWWTHLGDVVYRMTKQNKNPRFLFKRRIINKKDPADKWMFFQCQEDVRMGYLPIKDPAKIGRLACLALQYHLNEKGIKRPFSPMGLRDVGLENFISEEALKEQKIEDYATQCNNLFNVEIPKKNEDIIKMYVDICKQCPTYGMNLFYVLHDASRKEYCIGVDMDGIHVVHKDRSKVNRLFPYSGIRKFGATAEYFWMNVEDNNKSSGGGIFNVLKNDTGINVLMYTLQSWEMYDTVYDATHFDIN